MFGEIGGIPINSGGSYKLKPNQSDLYNPDDRLKNAASFGFLGLKPTPGDCADFSSGKITQEDYDSLK